MISFIGHCLGVIATIFNPNDERIRQLNEAAHERNQQLQATQERTRRLNEQTQIERQRRTLLLKQIELGKLLQNKIDSYIRTRRQFDSRNPLIYKCNLNSINQDADVILSLQQLNEYANVTLLNFVISEFIVVVIEGLYQVSVKYLTPFQGAETHRVFGSFDCSSCHNKWKSAATWKNKWQKCKRCESICYPFQQNILVVTDQVADNESEEPKRPHDTLRCQRCLELGRICLPRMYYDINN